MEKAQCTQLIKEAKSAQNWDAMLAACQQALQFFPEDKRFHSELDYAQTHYIEEKLNSDVVKDLEKKKDFQTLQAVYRKLLGAFPESKKLPKLLDEVAKKIQKAKRQEYKDYFSNAKKTVRNFMKEEKYEDAEQACYEILTQDPENPTFRKLLDKVNAGLDRNIHKQLKAYFKEAIPKLKAEYKADKKAFVRI